MVAPAIIVEKTGRGGGEGDYVGGQECATYRLFVRNNFDNAYWMCG